LITLIFDNHFERFPDLRIASVENGSQYLPDLIRKLRSTADKMPGHWKNDPVETLRHHMWMNPFWEDDVNEVAAWRGPARVIFGSEWPPIEALPEPTAYLQELKHFDAGDRRLLLNDNVQELITLRPTRTDRPAG
jgi:predicted TIM-barrel fold metal-dependent hydrolase